MPTYDRVLAHVAATPWAIEPGAGRVLAEALSRRVAGLDSPEGVAEAKAIADARAARKAAPRPRNVAVIPIYGVMTKRADLFSEVSGLLSTDQVAALVQQAADDPGVEAIVLDVDSPGGSVFGVEELAQTIAAAAKQKKVVAVANAMAASAAFYVASQASELVVSPSGMVGSIGVVMMHVDESKALEAAGQVVTVVASSELKEQGVTPGPLSDAGRAHLAEMVGGYYQQFVKAVARGRNVSQTKVREEFGQGGMVLADDAVARGMADRVATLDAVLGRYGMAAPVDLPRGEADAAPTAADDRGGIEVRKRKLRLG